MRISTVILAKNEEKNISKAIRSLSFCDEILVIDDFSNDKTADIAKKHSARVHQRKLDGDFAAQRNFGMQESRGDWILFVDADEVVTEELKQEILRLASLVQDDMSSAYHIKRRDYFWARELRYGEVTGARKYGFIRLVKKDSGKWHSPVHEVFKTDGKIGWLNSYLGHYPHPTIKEFLQEINFYSTLRAKELEKSGKKVNLITVILYPLAKFFLNYFIKLGFLDGPPGFVYAFMMSFHSFLVRAKLYQYTKL